MRYLIDVADLAALDELCAWMRSNGATSARLGDVSLTLGAPIAPAAVVLAGDEPPPESPDDRQRRDLETLLYSSGGDVDVFLGKRGVQ